ncbi:hypothetical protein Tco_0223071 [Tanacetum coccineum]
MASRTARLFSRTAEGTTGHQPHATQSSHPNPLIANYEKRNGRGTIEYQLQQVKNANLKWRELPSIERHAYYKSYGDVFIDYLWERALSIEGDEESELEHRLFVIHFSKLEIDEKSFNHDAYWRKIGEPTRTNPRTSLIKEPLMRIMYRLIIGSFVHRPGSKERCQKRDLWMMGALKESRGINLAWVIAEHLSKHALGLKENSLIYGGSWKAFSFLDNFGSILAFAILASSSEVPSVLEFLQRRKLEAKKVIKWVESRPEVYYNTYVHGRECVIVKEYGVSDISKPDISKASSAGGKLHILKPQRKA